MGFLEKTTMKADTKLTVVMCCHNFDRRSTAPSSGDFRQGPPPIPTIGVIAYPHRKQIPDKIYWEIWKYYNPDAIDTRLLDKSAKMVPAS